MIDYIKSLIGVIVFSLRRGACSLAWGAIKIKQYPMVRRLGRCGFTSNRLCNPAEGDKYAILATMARNYREDGFYDLLGLLREYKVNPILVVNRELDDTSFAELSALSHRIITRPNFGRDMGPFKEATLYLHDQNISPSRVLYFNDSLIYLPEHGLREMVKQLVESSSDVLGVTQSFERYYHIGSFIFSLSGKAFSHPGTRAFWENYRQYDLRPHCIIQGELGLSRWLQKQGFLLDVLYRPAHVADQVRSLDYDVLLDKFHLVRSGWRTKFMEHLATFSDLTCPRQLLYQSGVATLFQGQSQSQIHNYFGLFYEFLELPIIKKDIIYRGIFAEPEISMILSDLSTAKKTVIVKILNNRGLEQEKTGIKAFLARALMLE